MPTTCPKKNRLPRPLISLERLRAVLSYDPLTGHFLRLIQMGSRGTVGSRAGTLNADSGYRVIRIDNLNYYEHRLAWFYVHGVWAPELDHENLKRDNNWIDNIRVATRSQNSANTSAKANNKLGIKGVCWHPRNKKYMVRISKDRQTTLLGFFDDPRVAGAVYAEAAKRMFGEFART